ncbi:MAG TPA: molybdenum cofactor guanylyltransferase [Ktedonobacterales bacterium]|jgi:molybdopterin-guanine dinucleotide biosynthesis protein A|nr:molybdenum cofactor guanylyltransferase [Ktedonobacterales bacterium]
MSSDERAGDAAPFVGVLGVALAGGASRRMGRDKAALELEGEPLLRRSVARLRLALAEVIVVGAPTFAPLIPATRLVADDWPGRGPLGGLATALRAAEASGAGWALLVACDMPFIQPALLRAMARLALATPEAQAVALRGPRGLEPLHAVYARSCLPLALARLAAGDDASLHALLATLSVREIAPEDARRLDPLGRSTFNANTPEEWALAQRMAADGG